MKQNKINFKKLLLFGICLLIGAGISYFTQRPQLIRLWEKKSIELQEQATRLQAVSQLKSMSAQNGQVIGLNSWYLKDGRFESSIKDTLSTVDSLPMVLGAANIDVESATKTFDFLTQNGFDDMYKCAEAEKCIQPAYIEFEKENCGLRFNYDASELKTDKDYSKVQPLKNNWFYYCKDIKRSL